MCKYNVYGDCQYKNPCQNQTNGMISGNVGCSDNADEPIDIEEDLEMNIPNIEPNFDDLQSWCDRVPGLRDAIIGLKTSGFCGITQPIMGALLELGLFGNRAAMAQVADILQSS